MSKVLIKYLFSLNKRKCNMYRKLIRILIKKVSQTNISDNAYISACFCVFRYLPISLTSLNFAHPHTGPPVFENMSKNTFTLASTSSDTNAFPIHFSCYPSPLKNGFLSACFSSCGKRSSGYYV